MSSTRFSIAIRSVAAALLALALVGAPSTSQAGSGSIRIEIVKAGFIVGVSGGSGTLTLNGKRHALSIGGVSLGATIGASKAALSGRVLNINRASDIAGTYGAAEGGVTAVRGAKIARLRNAKGVILEVKGEQVGLEFTLDLGGMQVGLK